MGVALGGAARIPLMIANYRLNFGLILKFGHHVLMSFSAGFVGERLPIMNTNHDDGDDRHDDEEDEIIAFLWVL